MGTPKTYSNKQREHVEYLGSKGMSDALISKKTKVAYSVVQKIVTNYWEHKMKTK